MTENLTPPAAEQEISSPPTPETPKTEVQPPQQEPQQPEKKAKKLPFNLSKTAFSILCVLLALILLLSSTLSICFIKLYQSRRHGAVYEMDSELTYAEEGDRVPIWNPDFGYGAIPALEDVAISTYKEENFRTDSKGLKYYYEDDQLASYTGIDVSSFNGDIDFKAVKEYGIDFVIVRLGGRGYGSEGVIFEDDYALYNLREARKAGLMVGAYFFSQAITVEEAIEEANFCLDLLDGFYLDYPLAFDWENIDPSENPRTENIDAETLTNCAQAFCHTVNEAGYIPCLYTDSKKAYMKFDLDKLNDVDIWYAFYNDEPDMYYNYMIWQYSCTGYVEGIEGDVDLNICFKNYK